MDTRTRFHAALHGGHIDRVPYFEEGIRSEVIAAWKQQGLVCEDELRQCFLTDQRIELQLNISPYPPFQIWPASLTELNALGERLNPNDPGRIPADWHPLSLRQRDGVLMLRVHDGLFLSLGVDAAKRFTEVIYLLTDQPDFVRQYLRVLGEFAAELAERVLREVEVDALVFSEPIGDNNGALISPRMYEDLVLPGYEPLLNLAHRYGVDTIICRTYANIKTLIPSLMKWGMNCLWACEVEPEVMNYPALRREFGPKLALIGGIDADALREGKDAIRRAVDEITPLIAEGGYIPLVDGRVRADMPYEHYVYYRKLLQGLT